MSTDENSSLSFATPGKWRQWLERNHAKSTGVWLMLKKRDSPQKRLSYSEALDVALCYGWIDAQVKGRDENYYLRRFVPRKKTSIWSKINCGHVKRLTEAGLMHKSGLAEVERAKSDGRWEAAYEPQSRSKVPEDLQMALDERPKAKEFFSKLSSQNRYAILFRLQMTKKAETRMRKIEKFVEMLVEGRTFH